MFITAVNEMKLEKVKFIINNDFIDFNNECPSHMQLVEDEYFYGDYGSIYDKAIYECLYSHVCCAYGGYMEVANELLNIIERQAEYPVFLLYGMEYLQYKEKVIY